MSKQGSKRLGAEADFIAQLESLAHEQRKLAGTEILPRWAIWIGEWLVVNPWRLLIPLSFLLYLLLRLAGGTAFRELILGIFGGYR